MACASSPCRSCKSCPAREQCRGRPTNTRRPVPDKARRPLRGRSLRRALQVKAGVGWAICGGDVGRPKACLGRPGSPTRLKPGRHALCVSPARQAVASGPFRERSRWSGTGLRSDGTHKRGLSPSARSRNLATPVLAARVDKPCRPTPFSRGDRPLRDVHWFGLLGRHLSCELRILSEEGLGQLRSIRRPMGGYT
jgi:hypothetical protein